MYSVGSIDVASTQDSPHFSGAPVLEPGLPFTIFAIGFERQVAIVQAINATTQAVDWQAYFHGTPPAQNLLSPTNARGIAVWPDASPGDARVVICGETYDKSLPASQAPLGWPLANGTNASGFLAVFDGSGNLKWSHQFFGDGVAAADCAVTDVSVRVEMVNGVATDVITYCGISSHGSHSTNGTLAPFRWFTSTPQTPTLCPTSGIGNTNNGAGQWDGFVGRIARNHDATTGSTVTRFHAVVGGNQQDGLFGVAELPGDRFVTVGSTAAGREGIPSAATGATFPLTSGTCLPQTPGNYCLGVVLQFNAASTSPPLSGNLVLEHATEFGSQSSSVSTVARDVHAQGVPHVFGSYVAPSMVFVVGSTSDAAMFGSFNQQTVLSLLSPGAPLVFNGGVDGFVLGMSLTALPSVHPFQLQVMVPFGTFHGGPYDEELTGVHAWNEFSDHLSTVGRRRDPATGDQKIEVASYYGFSAGFNPPTQFPVLFPLTSILMGGATLSGDTPTAMGRQEITDGPPGAPPPDGPRLRFVLGGLGNHAGGGVAQDKDGRVNAVGRTGTSNYPVTPALGPFFAGRSRFVSSGLIPDPGDAVRTAVDLLPPSAGRTDATGPLPPTLGLFGALPGTDGGTTPPCALLRFGAQLGAGQPELRRMLIDYEGVPPSIAGGPGHIVCRPPGSMSALLAWFRLGFPGAPGTFLPNLLAGGIEDWILTPQVEELFVSPTLHATYRSGQISFPATTTGFLCSVQAFFLLATPVLAGNPSAGQNCAGGAMIAATPALFIAY